MLFGKKKTRPGGPRGPVANGPATPVMSVSAMKRALEHAAWRDPMAERRRSGDLRAAVRCLERAAACADQATERLAEVAEALARGMETDSRVMRGLLASRIEELLDSLERVAAMAQDGDVNLLDGGSRGIHVETGGFRYALNPVDVRRGPTGLDVPHLSRAFSDRTQAEAVAAAVERALLRMRRFGERLSYDASTLAGLMRATQSADDAWDGEEAPRQATPPPTPSVEAAPEEPPPAPPREDMFADVPWFDEDRLDAAIEAHEEAARGEDRADAAPDAAEARA